MLAGKKFSFFLVILENKFRNQNLRMTLEYTKCLAPENIDSWLKVLCFDLETFYHHISNSIFLEFRAF